MFPNEWRDASAADYDSDDWRAFTKMTGVETPWRIEGDFNGDGLKDVARIVMHEADQKWMLGVEFGSKPGAECKTFQISQGLPHQLESIPSLQTLPKLPISWFATMQGRYTRFSAACLRKAPLKASSKTSLLSVMQWLLSRFRLTTGRNGMTIPSKMARH